ncbi:MAG: hypothetical protein JW783_13120 [Bacteroidales bacterium]|nr:hypothetical protein [Bacteroidales bacterium]MBN2749545.1 hypothetical protein [Bacteroidales bacterium]
MQREVLVFLIVVISSICYSCQPASKSSNFTEGVIEYEITYNDSLNLKYNTNLLPNLMVIKFKDGNSLNRIEGFSGAIALTYINSKESNSNIVLVKILNKRLFYQENKESAQEHLFFSQMPELRLEKQPEEFEYNGYKCKKAIAHLKDSLNTTFEIIYTNDIGISAPNANTPFAEIEGVMMRFNIKLGNYLMTLDVSRISKENVKSNEFSIPTDYEKVNRETIYNVLELMQ